MKSVNLAMEIYKNGGRSKNTAVTVLNQGTTGQQSTPGGPLGITREQQPQYQSNGPNLAVGKLMRQVGQQQKKLH
jgi:siroheme synthase